MPIHLAVHPGNSQTFRALCETGSNVFSRDESRRTPRHVAVGMGQTEVVKASVKFGAELEVTDKRPQQFTRAETTL